MRILIAHTNYDFYGDGPSRTNNWIARLKIAGYDVEGFSLVYSQDRPILYFRELNLLWKHRDKNLIALYQKLLEKISEFDVLMLYNGANLHPDFVDKLNCIKVYCCFDDPESSDTLSKPVVSAFDIALVGNIAAVDTYKDWGVKLAYWWPIGFRLEDYDPDLDSFAVLQKKRECDIALLCERISPYRKERVDKIQKAYPLGAYYGKGWDAGYLPENKRVPLLQNTKIGINIHNSTGPINFRTFYLPANGVLQICDNKSNLYKIFKKNEVVGYDSTNEAIELIRYYLHNERERVEIALAGWRRVIDEYNEIAVFQKAIEIINKHYLKFSEIENLKVKLDLKKQRKFIYVYDKFILLMNISCIKIKKIIKKIHENIFRYK